MAEQFKYEFEVLRGNHAEGKDEKGKQIIHRNGDKFKTNVDLRRYNTPAGDKFRLLNEVEIKPVKAKA